MSVPPIIVDDNRLAPLAGALVRDCRAAAALGWPEDLVARCVDAVETLIDLTTEPGLAPVRETAMDLYAYLVGIEETSARTELQGLELARLADQLAEALACSLPAGARALPCIDLLSSRDDFPPALAQSFTAAGYALRRFADCGELAAAARVTPGAVMLVETSQLAPACAVLDALAGQVPASGGTVLFGIGPGNRLQAMLQGAEGHADSLDEDDLAARVLELVEAPREQPYRVLVVDDDASSRGYLRLVLEQGGMQVQDCADPREVPARIAEQAPDLLLSDLYMPELDGLSLTLQLRRQPELALLPILLISGEEREQVRFQAIRAGADDFLRKPVRPRVLVAEVRSRIKRARVARRHLPAVTQSAPVTRRGGQLRRGDFLTQLGEAQRHPRGPWQVLLSVKIDQAAELGKRLGQAGAYDLEQAMAERFAELCAAEDAYTLWLEFGFGILVQRDSSEQVAAFAQALCRHVANRPFLVQGAPMDLTVSVGLALPPTGAAAGDPDRWFAAAYAGMSIAHRLGGDRYDGVLSLKHGDMPAERVLIIREFVKNAARGEHIVIEFQPMLPLRSGAGGQYALVTKLRDFRAPLAGIRRDEYLDAAREAGALGMIERTGVFSAFEAIQEERGRGRNTRILVPMDLASLDKAQLGWLSAELRRRRSLADGLVIEIDAGALLAQPTLAEVVAQLKACEVTLSLSEPSGSLASLEHLQQLPVDLLRLPQAAIAGVSPAALSELLAPWRARGRGLIIDHVHNLDNVSQLWELGIDFLQGDALAAAGPRLDYDFMQVSG